MAEKLEAQAPAVPATVSKEEYDKVVADSKELKEAYDELVNAFNTLLKEFNDMHVALLFKK